MRGSARPIIFVVAIVLIGALATWQAYAATVTYSLWSTNTKPQTVTENDNKAVELGVRFHAKVAGYISGIRFYKGPQNTGTHIGNLWDTHGHLLAQVTFRHETGTGWQTATFSKPVSIAANVDYIASYFAPNSHYSVNDDYFTNHARVSGNLVAPRDTSDNPNGVYAYSKQSTFPNQTYRASNYWVDVLFTSKLINPQPAPAAPTNVTATVQGTDVVLGWNNSVSAAAIKNYAIYRDGNKIATVGNSTSYNDNSTSAGGTYKYQVQAIDVNNTPSPLSTAVTVAIPANPPAPSPTPPPSPIPSPPPIPKPDPGPCPTSTWPTPENTGAFGTLTDVTGDVTLDTPGQTYQNMRVKGTIVVTACDVTLKNVEVDAGSPFTGDSTPDLFAIWLQVPETCNTTIDHVSVITNSAPNNYMTTGIRIARGNPVLITNSKITGPQLGILGIASGTAQENYILLGPTMRGDHDDAIQGDGSNGLTIAHNTLLNPNAQTSALALYTEFGPNSNDVVRDNLFAGGGYACYCGDGKTDNNGNPAPASNVSFINNVFSRKYYPDVGEFGPGRAYNPANGGQWTNNLYMNADGTLTTEQVPQPPLDQ